ncbi:endonuclease III [Candidatus Babeliales bacterium]|nr:endonuclease III [Candidatus Babeliales bacterium]
MGVGKIKNFNVECFISHLRSLTCSLPIPAALSIIDSFGRDPFLILISCILSLRTRDTISFPASMRLFSHARTPQDILKIPSSLLEKLIFPVGFYKQKTLHIKEICIVLLKKYKGLVPSDQKKLLGLKGVGLKTAHLVLGLGFGIPALCVDTHVHRISNELGLVDTKTADETEAALQKVIPQKYWIEFNTLLVMWGQNMCPAHVKKCKGCRLQKICLRNNERESF